MNTLKDITIICLLMLIFVVGICIHLDLTKHNVVSLEAEKPVDNVYLIARCKAAGSLAATFAKKVTMKVPLQTALEAGDGDSDALYILKKAYSSALLRTGSREWIPEFETDIIVDCLNGDMDS